MGTLGCEIFQNCMACYATLVSLENVAGARDHHQLGARDPFSD